MDLLTGGILLALVEFVGLYHSGTMTQRARRAQSRLRRFRHRPHRR